MDSRQPRNVRVFYSYSDAGHAEGVPHSVIVDAALKFHFRKGALHINNTLGHIFTDFS